MIYPVPTSIRVKTYFSSWNPSISTGPHRSPESTSFLAWLLVPTRRDWCLACLPRAHESHVQQWCVRENVPFNLDDYYWEGYLVSEYRRTFNGDLPMVLVPTKPFVVDETIKIPDARQMRSGPLARSRIASRGR